MLRASLFAILITLASCSHYQHLKPALKLEETDTFLVILVNARHFDYCNGQRFIYTMQSRPDFGHAWIYLKGNGQIFEGGHSGELGVRKARYFDGIMNNIEWGYSNPGEHEKKNPRYEPNPASYLFESLDDGFFQSGSGGHTPTYAIKVNLTDKQWQEINAYIRRYDFINYSITKNQCATFAKEVALIAGLDLEDKVLLKINSDITVFGCSYRMRRDEKYSKIIFSSPDMLEISMKRAVKEGLAEEALNWYLSQGESSVSGRQFQRHGRTR